MFTFGRSTSAFCFWIFCNANRRHLSRENSGRWCLLLHGYETGVERLSICYTKRKHLIFIPGVFLQINTGCVLGLAFGNINMAHLVLSWCHDMGMFSGILARLWRETNGHRRISHKEPVMLSYALVFWLKWDTITLTWRHRNMSGELLLSAAPICCVKNNVDKEPVAVPFSNLTAKGRCWCD